MCVRVCGEEGGLSYGTYFTVNTRTMRYRRLKEGGTFFAKRSALSAMMMLSSEIWRVHKNVVQKLLELVT